MASLSTPRVPEGVMAQPSAPQFSPSQAVIWACHWPTRWCDMEPMAAGSRGGAGGGGGGYLGEGQARLGDLGAVSLLVRGRPWALPDERQQWVARGPSPRCQ